MDYLRILIAAPCSYAALFLITKLIGYRQISQLSIFDYINGITIGSIAAEMATELENPLRPLLAMGIYGLLVVITSAVTSRSIRCRRWLSGRSLVLFRDGTLYRDNLKKGKLDVNEFLSQCRDNGFFDLNELELAVLETSGKISFQPKSSARPATPRDMGVIVEPATAPVNLVIDGRILEENLRFLGVDAVWLDRKLAEQNVTAKGCLLVTGDRSGTVTVFPLHSTPPKEDLY